MTCNVFGGMLNLTQLHNYSTSEDGSSQGLSLSTVDKLLYSKNCAFCEESTEFLV